MRVLLVAENLDQPEFHFILGAGRRSVSPTVAVNPADARGRALAEQGMPVVPCTLHGRIDRKAIAQLRRLLHDGRFDAVHCLRNNRPLSNMLFAARGMAIPIVAYRGTIGHLGWWDPGSWLTYLNPRVTRIVCVSEAVRRYLLSLGIPEERVVTIYKGHDVTWYTPAPRSALAEFGIPGDAFVAGCTASMRPVKGVPVLLEAVRQLPAAAGVHVLLVGDVRDGRIGRMLKSPRIGPRVHLAGYRQDAAALMGACDVFVMPSVKREGLPRALMEAMAQGVAPIVTRVGGMPELITHDVHGLIVAPRDPEGLAGALAALAGDPERRRRLGAQARERIRRDFSIATTIDTTLRLYESIVRR